MKMMRMIMKNLRGFMITALQIFTQISRGAIRSHFGPIRRSGPRACTQCSGARRAQLCLYAVLRHPPSAALMNVQASGDDSEDEWLTSLCRSKKERSRSPPWRWLEDELRNPEHRVGYLKACSARSSQASTTASSELEACISSSSSSKRPQASSPHPTMAAFATFRARSQGSRQPPVVPVTVRSPPRQPPAPAAKPEVPAAPPGPLEVPELVDDASSSESDGEDQKHADREMQDGLKYERETVQPNASLVAHLINKRLRRAAKRGLGVQWARQVSFNAEVTEVIDWAVYKIDSARTLGSGYATRFKVGITHNPSRRWFNNAYGYRQEGWGTMQVLWVTRPRKAAELETRLITYYKKTKAPGRYNIRPGGESCPRTAPVFVYAVFGFGP